MVADLVACGHHPIENPLRQFINLLTITGLDTWRGRALYAAGSWPLLHRQAPKEQYPINSQVSVLLHVSALESDVAASTDGENRRPNRDNPIWAAGNLSGSVTEGMRPVF